MKTASKNARGGTGSGKASCTTPALSAMDEDRWDRALERFNRVIEMNGSRVDAAMYWKAYAQNRLGQRAESLATIAELIKSHPNSRYASQAKQLEADVRRSTGQPGEPGDAGRRRPEA